MATGRSDYPNQVNNVLGFSVHLPWRARHDGDRDQRRDEDGRSESLAELRKKTCPRAFRALTAVQQFKFGRDYLIPKPFDRRALLWVAPAVAEAAMKSGVARKKDRHLEYRDRLETAAGLDLHGHARNQETQFKRRSKEKSATIVFPEGETSENSSRGSDDSRRRNRRADSSGQRSDRSKANQRTGLGRSA